jgi:cation/acetate symporter
VLGWTGGFVLVSILVGPYLRKFGAYTVPDFLAFRFGGNFARFLGVLVLVCCSFTYVTAQIYGTGLIASRFLGMQFEIAVFVGLVGILLCAMLGGMRAVTWTQIAQYIVLIVAYLVPIVILSTKKYGIPIPELTYGLAIEEITAREKELVSSGLAILCTKEACPPGTLRPHIQPFMNYTPLNFFGIIFCMMVGTASLPHILMRYFTTPSVRDARKSVGWSLFFIFLLYFSAPAYAAFSKLEVYTNIIGRDLNAIRPWLFTWGELGLIQVCGKNAATLDTVLAACKAIAGHPGVLRFQDFVINTDVIVLSTPEIAGLPYVISGLVAAGGLAAALSTADGLLLAIANALSHDIYYKMIQPLRPVGRSVVVTLILAAIVASVIWFMAAPGPYGVQWRWWALGVGVIPPILTIPFWIKMDDVTKRLTVARILLLYVAATSAALAATKPSDILAMVGWAFSLAMAGNFPAIVMGIWWKRTTTAAAICGIIAGWALCLFYLVTSRYFPQAGVTMFGMTSLLNPETGQPLVNVAAILADPKWIADVPASAANPLANRVGWFDLNNINCGLLGMPLGFFVIWLVSLFTRQPSEEMRAFIDEIRKPRGRTVLEEKTT